MIYLWIIPNTYSDDTDDAGIFIRCISLYIWFFFFWYFVVCTTLKLSRLKAKKKKNQTFWSQHEYPDAVMSICSSYRSWPPYRPGKTSVEMITLLFPCLVDLGGTTIILRLDMRSSYASKQLLSRCVFDSPFTRT